MSATSPTPFAHWLKQRRRELDLTQEDLAERLNCSVVTISKIEMGQRRPSKQMAELLVAELRVPVHARDDFLRFARGLTDTFPTPATPPSLPTPTTPLLGRDHEMARITHVLNEAGGRLLTLTGPGGVGKTRLALQAAHALSATRAGGAAFVSLAGAAHSGDAPSAIATALGLTSQGAGEVAPQLIAYLRPRHGLLVLDNLEHLLADGAMARWVAQLLADAPRLQIIATSREPLRLPGEWDLRVHGLPLPAAGAGTSASSAMQLFVQAAQRADAQFAPDAEDLAAVARICRLVDGVPLAIELAAAWVSALRPEEIADEITRSLDFLATSSAAIDERQRSIRAVFEQSWRLLNQDDQHALAAMSAFRGGFTREAVASVAAVSLPQLATLLGKSLIRRDASGRYDLHELVRQFAAEKLALDDDSARKVHDAHTHSFLSMLNEAEPKLRSAEQDAMLNRLVGDVDNLRAAWDRAVARGWLDEINAAMRGLARLYSIKSWNEEGVQRFGVAAALRDDASTAHVLTYQAWFYASLEDWANSFRAMQDIFVRLQGVTDPHVLIEPNLFHALTLYKAERHDEATEAMQRTLALARQINNRWFEGIAMYALSYNAFLRDGETVNSFDGVMRAAEMVRAEGDMFQAVNLTQSAIHIAMAAGRFDDAERLLAETADITERLGGAYYVGGIEFLKGQLAVARGHHDSARRHLERSLALFQESHASKQSADVRALLDSLSVPSANTNTSTASP